MSETIEQKCLAKGVKLTDQRRVIAQVMSESTDHPDVDELYNRVSKIDPKISIATVYRTVKLFEESGILTKHEFKGGKARYEELNEGHHDHLIDVKTGEIIEFVDEEIEKLQKKGVKLTDQRKVIAKVLSESKEIYGESDHPDVDELYKRQYLAFPPLNSCFVKIPDSSNNFTVL